jgi:hypothetical protein
MYHESAKEVTVIILYLAEDTMAMDITFYFAHTIPSKVYMYKIAVM